jgi:hypothetical protein
LGHLIKYLVSPIVGAAVGLINAAATLPAAAEEPILPQYQPDIHLGVASCAGSTCHGATAPWKGSNVLQNEYATWQRSDKHAKAYEVLLNDKSKRIAKNLGLKNAHTAAVCLDCHADNVPAKTRAKQFQISDGVGCEACHGGAMRWLGIHVSGAATRKAEVAAGMFPTEDLPVLSFRRRQEIRHPPDHGRRAPQAQLRARYLHRHPTGALQDRQGLP